MKTNLKDNRKAGFLVLVFSAILAAVLMNACAKSKDSGGGGGAPPPNPYGCINCPPQGGSVLASAYGVHNPNTIALGMTFFAQTGTTQGGYYAGPVTAQGEMFVGGAAGSQYCPLIPGTYSVNTIQAGNWSANRIYQLRAEAVGPGGRVVLQFYQNGIYSAVPSITSPSGRVYANHLYGDVLIESVNGQPCQPLYPYYLQ